MRIDYSLTIDRTAEDVFAYLTDLERLPEWQSTAVEVRKQTEGPVGAGSRYTDVRRFLGRTIESTLEVTTYEPPSRFDVRATGGPVPFEVHHTLTPENGRTRLEWVAEGEPGGFFRMAEAIVRRAAEREFTAHLDTLKRVLETR
jgi:carbon monoxide dehydrogenase subunit G